MERAIKINEDIRLGDLGILCVKYKPKISTKLFFLQKQRGHPVRRTC
jgi:hypothetical protein